MNADIDVNNNKETPIKKIDLSKIMVKLRIAYIKLNKRSNGTVRIIRIVLDRLGKTQATQAAAAMAFYAFFSIFPLLLLLIGVGSFWLDNEAAYQKVIEIATQLLPTASELINANLQQVIELRGATGSIGIIGFIWSSSSFFSVLTRNVNMAQNAPRRNFFEDRAIAIGIVLLLTLLFGLSLISNTLVAVLPKFDIVLWDGTLLQDTNLWKYFLKIVPTIVSWGLFIILYRFTPKKKVSMKSVMIAATFTAIGWQVASYIFSWMINFGYIQYELIYGSLGTVVALMFWIYLISYITLIGAHLNAVLEESYVKKSVFKNVRNQKSTLS
ncbi:MAG TPA: hypothetical protein DCK95_02945 [Anaerolineaceae bacterium]|uniref:YihY family protein n=1 Tax=Anaerolinea thermophila TaxID=167964 RepID=A0A101FZ24_9CHLR|nr:MAG: YihY family protein [Anaerolinea thermophila]HAF61265.1 hypothetical protein [Anaerolineaceae bacterium]